MASPPNRIAEFRKKRKLSQQELADAIDAHWVTISKLERGKMQFTWEWAEQIAPTLKVDPAALFIERRGSKLVFPSELVVDDGRIFNIPEAKIPEVDIAKGYDDQYGSGWLGIGTDSFGPLVPRGSLVLLKDLWIESEISNVRTDRSKYVGHLCLIQPRDWPDADEIAVPLFGYLQFGSKPNYYTLTDGRRPIIQDTRVLRLSVVAAVIVHPELTAPFAALFKDLSKT